MCLSTPLDSLKGHRKKLVECVSRLHSIHSRGIEKAGRAACAEPAEVSREKLAKVSRDALDKLNEASRVFLQRRNVRLGGRG